MQAPPRTPEEVQRALQERADGALAQQPGQVHVRRFRIAGLAMEFTFAGTKLADIFTRSLSHLQVASFLHDERLLRATLWDEAATGAQPFHVEVATVFPGAGWFADGDLARSEDSRYCIYANARGTTLLDFAGASLLGSVKNAEELTLYEAGKPLQPILFAWSSRHDLQPVHAACVARSSNGVLDGVLIGGAGGSGKSTTSLACTMAGFSYLADDYTALPPANRHQDAFSLYASLWLEEDHSKRFAHLLEHRIDGVHDPELKRPFALGDAHPEQMATCCTVRAVILPRVTGLQTSRLTPADRLEAMVKMAPSSVLQLPFINPAASLQRIADLHRRVPAFWLDLGTEISTIAPRVEEALHLAMHAEKQT